MDKVIKYWIWLPVIISIWLNWNNICKFNPDFGFDGKDHQSYIRYVEINGKLPLPHEGWETNQPPGYYLAGAVLRRTNLPVQMINFVVFYIIAGVIYRYTKSKMSLMAFLALPMANIFPPLVTNELLGSFFVVFGLLLMVYQPKIEMIIPVLVMGFYSKYTILTLMPVMPFAYLFEKYNIKQSVGRIGITVGLVLIAALPLLIRDYNNYRTLLPLAPHFYKFTAPKEKRDIIYFINLDWIRRGDTFNANSYSFTGGIWDTFWLDGFQVITPVVAFHKKALLLWMVGFPLFGLSGWGLIRLGKTERRKAVVLGVYAITAWLSLIKYCIDLPYASVVKAFYAFGLVVPYVIGIKKICEPEAQKAIDMFNGHQIDNRSIIVNEARPQTNRDNRSRSRY